MAEIITLHATPRPPQGTRPVRRLRAEGKIPGVVYGLGGDPITLSVEWRELRAALVTEQGLNAVLMSGDALVDKQYWEITGATGEGTLMTFAPDPRKSPAAAARSRPGARRGR